MSQANFKKKIIIFSRITHDQQYFLIERREIFDQYIFFNFLIPQMKYLAAYALLALSGKKEINAGDIKTLLGSVQTNATDVEINKVIDALRGKTIHQLIAEGQARLGSASAAPSNNKKDAPKKEEKKEEPKKKQQPKKKVEEAPKEEEDADLGDLFG